MEPAWLRQQFVPPPTVLFGDPVTDRTRGPLRDSLQRFDLSTPDRTPSAARCAFSNGPAAQPASAAQVVPVWSLRDGPWFGFGVNLVALRVVVDEGLDDVAAGLRHTATGFDPISPALVRLLWPAVGPDTAAASAAVVTAYDVRLDQLLPDSLSRSRGLR